MKKHSPWVYLLFGVYPISLFDLANSKWSGTVQSIILSVVASSLFLTANVFQVLSLFSVLIILLFVLTSYIIGKHIRRGE